MADTLLKRYNAERAYLFGSYARGEATPESDIDLIVYGGESFSPTDILAFAEDLAALSGKRVDVFERGEILSNSPLMRSIEEDMRLIA